MSRLDGHGNRVRITQGPEHHLVMLGEEALLYCEANGRRLWKVARIPDETVDECVRLIRDLRAVNRAAYRDFRNQQPGCSGLQVVGNVSGAWISIGGKEVGRT